MIEAKKISPSLSLILEKLGYIESDNLFFTNNIDTCSGLSFHYKKVLKEINPYAFYCIGNKPFVLFFENNNENETNITYKKIWNAQIPVAIFNNDTDIRIFNGNELFDKDHLKSLETITIDNCNENSNFSYWNITKTGFWSDFSEKYSAKKLNELMLENIEYVTDKLKNEYKINFATKLILRLIFIRFLIDRGVDIGYSGLSFDINTSKANLLNIASSKKNLYSLFSYLNNNFNGNLFDLNGENEGSQLPDGIFPMLNDFLSGNLEQRTGQSSLFPLYDFNIIPVELISNIFEVLLGKETQLNDKAFYTPHYLVDYILSETVDKYLLTNQTCKVLDPSCGSGIFLVDTFRRLIDNNCITNGCLVDDNKLINLLTDNIFGVDKNADAIDVAIFSLYLTILDYKDPKALNGFKLPNLLGVNLFVSDFFDNKKTKKLSNVKFDFILGNPPWGNVKTEMLNSFRQSKKYPQQNNEISRDFIIRVGEFSNSSTLCCLVLPSKILYNGQIPAVKFRKKLLEEYKIETIIELSSVRKLVFKNADAPAVIISFRKSDDALTNTIKHVSLKPNVFFKLFNIIVKEKNDTKFVKQSLLLNFDWAWKTLVFGTIYDFEIIKNLKTDFNNIHKLIKDKILISDTGISANDGDLKPCDQLVNQPYLNQNDNIEHFYIHNINNLPLFKKNKIHRPKPLDFFSPPFCLIRKGVDCKTYKMRASYTDKKFIYNSGIAAFKADNKNKDILLNLTGLLNSSFYAYLNLMIGSSIGIEREQRFLSEIKEFSYVFNQKIVEKVSEIIVRNNKNDREYISISSKIISELDELILSEFGLANNDFIDYALKIQIPEITNINSNYKLITANREVLKKYADIFTDYWINKLQKDVGTVKIKIYPNIKNKFTVFEMIIDHTISENMIEFIQRSDSIKEQFSQFMIHKTNDMFYDIKNVINFENNSFYIIKTNEAKNWHPAIARIDLSDVIESILVGSEVLPK